MSSSPPPAAVSVPPAGLDPAAEEVVDDLGLQEHDATRQLRNGLIALALMAAIVIGTVLAVPGLDGVEDVVLKMSLPLLIAAVLFEVLSNVGYIITFLLVFKRIPFKLGARVALAETAFGTAVPLGGAGSVAVGAWLLVERGAPGGKVARRSAILFLLTSGINALTLGVVGLVAWTGLLPGKRDPLLTLVPGLVGLGAVAFFLLIPPLTDRLVTSAASGHAHVDELLASRGVRWAQATSGTIRDTARLLFTPNWRLLGAWGYLWFDIGVLWLCFLALGKTPPITSIVLAYQIGYIVNLLPIPGSIGVLDGSFVGMLVLFGVKADDATAATLVYHAIALAVPVIWGTIAFLSLRRDRSTLQLRPAKPPLHPTDGTDVSAG